MSVVLDHLVVGADTLEQGAAWCEATLGLTPRPGGRHVFMGTHNRLLSLSSTAYPRAYLEIIAIDPQAQAPSGVRWFGLDEPAVQAQLRQAPRLLHWVARSTDLKAACAALTPWGLDVGVPTSAERDTPRGRLQWTLSLRPDGQPQWAGALPTLIEWGSVHPADDLPLDGLTVTSLTLAHAPLATWQAVREAWHLRGVQLADSGPALCACLDTPLGEVCLESLY